VEIGSQNRDHESVGIAQLHPLGCSVACVAYRCGISYPHALSLFTQPDLAWRRGFYCSEVVEALARAGFNYEYAEYDKTAHSHYLDREGTIIFIGHCDQYPAGHFLVRARRGWMNSWANYPVMVPVETAFQSELVSEICYIIFEI